MNYEFELKHALSDDEFVQCFNFMKTYLVFIYGEDSISDENFNIWKTNRVEKENRFLLKFQKIMMCVDMQKL